MLQSCGPTQNSTKKGEFFIFWSPSRSYRSIPLFILVHFETWNDLFCTCMDNVSPCEQCLKLFILSPNRSCQFNSRVVTCFESQRAWSNREVRRSYLARYEGNFTLFCKVRHGNVINACCTCSTIIFPPSANHVIEFWHCLCRRPHLSAYFQQLLDWMFWKWRFLLNYQLLWRFFLIKRKEPAHQTGERSYIIQ